MPFINTYTNTTITDEKASAIKEKFGNAISIMGKSESWLMVGFCDNEKMFFKGENSPAAFIDVSVFGDLNSSQCQSMTQAVCKIINDELDIPFDKIYIKYSGSHNWGWNNMNF